MKGTVQCGNNGQNNQQTHSQRHWKLPKTSKNSDIVNWSDQGEKTKFRRRQKATRMAMQISIVRAVTTHWQMIDLWSRAACSMLTDYGHWQRWWWNRLPILFQDHHNQMTLCSLDIATARISFSLPLLNLIANTVSYSKLTKLFKGSLSLLIWNWSII